MHVDSSSKSENPSKIRRIMDTTKIMASLMGYFLVISKTNWRCVKANHTNQLIEFGLVMLFRKYSLVYAFNNNLAIFHCPLKTFVIWFCRRWSSTNGTVSVQNPYIFRFYNQQNELKTHDFIHQKKKKMERKMTKTTAQMLLHMKWKFACVFIACVKVCACFLHCFSF